MTTQTPPTDAEWLERARRSAETRVSERGAVRELELLPPHASLRRYARARFGECTEIVMLMPPGGPVAEEAGGGTSVRLADDPWVVVQGWLAAAGVAVPRIHGVDEVVGAIWMEDLGGTDFDMAVRADPSLLEVEYERALDLLDSFQRATRRVDAAPAAVRARTFDAALLRWELDHYVEWRLGAELGARLAEGTRSALSARFDALVAELVQMPSVVMHRDFQSHNLMVVGAERRLVLLDFQDAMIGPLVYDAVALLRDSYVVLPPDVLERCVSRFAETVAGRVVGVSREQVVRWFHLQAVQRKLKDSGRFVFIDRVKGNPGFLRYIPDSLAYVRASLARLPELDGLAAILGELDPALRATR